MENRVGDNYSKRLSDPHPVQVGSTAASSDLFRAIHHMLSEKIDQARLNAVSTQHAGDWLCTLPITSCGLKLSDEAVRVAVGLRLGANICEPHTCACGVPVTAKGEHGLSCQLGFGTPRGRKRSNIQSLIGSRVSYNQGATGTSTIGWEKTGWYHPYSVESRQKSCMGRHGDRHSSAVVPGRISRSVGSSGCNS